MTNTSTTPPFPTVRYSRGRLFATLLYLYGMWPILLISLLLFATLLAGIFIDLRWGMVFLLIIFILGPMLITLLYFYHGLRPSTALNILPHNIIFGEESISFEVFCMKPTEEDETDELLKEMHASKADAEETDGYEDITVLYRKEYPFSKIRRIYTDSDTLIIMLRTPDKGFLMVPFQVCPSQDYVKDLISKIKLNENY